MFGGGSCPQANIHAGKCCSRLTRMLQAEITAVARLAACLVDAAAIADHRIKARVHDSGNNCPGVTIRCRRVAVMPLALLAVVPCDCIGKTGTVLCDEMGSEGIRQRTLLHLDRTVFRQCDGRCRQWSSNSPPSPPGGLHQGADNTSLPLCSCFSRHQRSNVLRTVHEHRYLLDAWEGGWGWGCYLARTVLDRCDDRCRQ